MITIWLQLCNKKKEGFSALCYASKRDSFVFTLFYNGESFGNHYEELIFCSLAIIFSPRFKVVITEVLKVAVAGVHHTDVAFYK